MKKEVKTTLICALTAIIVTACHKKSDDKSEPTQDQHASVYACPMHPEVTGKKGDKCPKCGMELQAVSATKKEDFTMKLVSPAQNIEAGKPAELSFDPINNGNPDEKVDLEIQHEKEFHLIAVSENLAWFDHIHPKRLADGSYTVSETFPNGGNYLLFADYKPVGSAPQLEKIAVAVKGNTTETITWTEPKLVAKTDGYTVTFVNGNDLKTNRAQHVGFAIEKNGRQLKGSDMQKYLGANAHIVMIGVSDKAYIHIHPESDGRYPIYGQTSFSKPGMYRLWVQFQIGGKVHTTDFTVKVTQGPKEAQGEKQEHAHH